MQLSSLYDVHDNFNHILITVKKYIEKYFSNVCRSEHTTLVFNSLIFLMEVTDSLMLPQLSSPMDIILSKLTLVNLCHMIVIYFMALTSLGFTW
jgi:hypothetical protein